MTDDWRIDAPCVNDPRIFATEPRAVAEAISTLCGQGGPGGSPCPVWRACREWALSERTASSGSGFDGIAGGAWFSNGRVAKVRVVRPDTRARAAADRAATDKADAALDALRDRVRRDEAMRQAAAAQAATTTQLRDKLARLEREVRETEALLRGTPDPIKAGHAAFIRGERDEATMTAQRTYQRERMRRARALAKLLRAAA